MKYTIGILIGIALNLGNMDILVMLTLPIHEHGISSTYLYFLQSLSSVSYNFLSTGLLHPWLDLFQVSYSF